MEIVIIAPLGPIRSGDQFEQGKVPLHLTMLPTIRVSEDRLPAVVSGVGEVASAHGPVGVVASEYAQFGSAADVPVTTVRASEPLQHLHLRLLESARRVGATPRQPAYNGNGYRPHITHTHDGQVIRPGVSVTLTELAVLDCSQPTRRISVVWPLVGRPHQDHGSLGDSSSM